MKHIFFFSVMFAMVNVVFAQQDVPEDGFGLPVLDSSPQVFSHESICYTDPKEDICEVTIRCQTDVFPVEFIQGEKVLFRLEEMPKDSLVVIQGVKYTPLANGWKYQLDLKNPVGRTVLLIQRGGA
ncbi:MAG: hypothetical protein R3B39_00925 [Candidatus Paceibacterota bacterium]